MDMMITAPQQDWELYRQLYESRQSQVSESLSPEERWGIYRDLFRLVWTIKGQLPPADFDSSRWTNQKWADKELRRNREAVAFQQLGRQ